MKKIVFILALCMTQADAGAQSLQNNGNLQIHAGGSLSAFGDFSQTSTGSLVNNGNLHLKANASNALASMATGSGTLYLDGSSNQTLSGSQPFRAYHFVSNNSAGIILNNELRVSGTHSFTSGIIQTSAINYLVYEPGASYTGDNDQKHVQGWVKKIGATNFVFPVGNGSVERTISLTGLSTSGEFAARYYTNTPYSTNLQAPLINIDDNEYWAVTKISGGNAQAFLNWDNNKIPFVNWQLSEITVASFDGSNWTDAGGTASGNVTTTGSITSNSLSTLNLFTFGRKTYVLPVNLLAFTATRINGYSLLNWKTEKEENGDRFMVERSDNGFNFYAIGTMPARATGKVEAYAFEDRKGINQAVYYRLRSIHNDGRNMSSNIVRLEDKLTSPGLQLVSNPVKGSIVLTSNNVNGIFQYSILNSAGAVLQKGSADLQNNSFTQLPVSSAMKTGSYFLILQNGLARYSFPFIVL